MRYIKSLHLKNFQSYRDQVINFTEGLNLILGSSDSGKSAIMRAISFVIYNYPRNSTLIHHGEDQTEVTIVFSDGLSVTRIKGRRNAYIAKTPTGKVIELDKVDKTVPEEIKVLLNNPPEDDFNGFISYADQFSKMFLVDLSPTDLPRSLSHLTGVEILEECSKTLMQSYKSTEKQVKINEKEYEKINNEYRTFDELYDIEKQSKAIQEKIDQQSLIQAKINELLDYECEIDENEYKIRLSLINQLIELINLCLSKISDIETKITEMNSLNLFNLMNEYNYSNYDLNIINSTLQKVQKVQKTLLTIENLAHSFSEYNSINKEYQRVKQEGKDTSAQYSEAQLIFKELSEDYKIFIDDLVQKNVICDKCGSLIK